MTTILNVKCKYCGAEWKEEFLEDYETTWLEFVCLICGKLNHYTKKDLDKRESIKIEFSKS